MRRGVIYLGIVLAVIAIGCKGQSPKTPDQVKAETEYTAALVRCVDKNETREKADECRVQVNKEYGITPPKD